MKLAEVDNSALSPMMQQYISIKKTYQKHILFFRLGDFYEMFFEDAIIVAKELELTLTGRDCGLDERAPMCGVPFHACETYLKKLLAKGYNVAICEQTSDPAASKGIVTREVVRIVTPGTIIESNLLDETSNNYICAIYYEKSFSSMCFADISTGEVHLFEYNEKATESKVIDNLARYSPAEILFNQDFLLQKNATEFIKDKLKSSVQLLDDVYFDENKNVDNVTSQFSISSLSELGILENKIAQKSLCALFTYISETQKALIGRFSEINFHSVDNIMKLGFSARRNLELCETMRNKDKKGSLLWVLDNTRTSMGKRLLKSYIEQPLTNPAKIIDRLDAVEELINNPVKTADLQQLLSSVYDIERLMTRVMYKTATPRDIKALSLTAVILPEIKKLLDNFSATLLIALNFDMNTLEEISNLVENSIVDEPPVNLKDGGVIKDGFNSELDELRDIISGGKSIIEKIENKEREATGIRNLKVSYNKVFGYYFEVTKSYYDLIPDYFIRKQTLSNCERFITDELKIAENTILGANDKTVSLESDIFCEIRDFIATKLSVVQKTATALANIDVLVSLAVTAMKNNYTKPHIAIDGIIDIKNGRHPVVELMQNDEIFVPNDAFLDLTDNKMLIITGPNMAGKSTFMRQVALIALMAQLGSFVPCDYAKISVVDQIFTRVGASDDLTSGQSTFMVEMSEVADIVNNATKNSLVILDEVGRGTSTFDGISIAKAVAEYIATSKNIGCKTLFATHYHELIDLENELEGVKNFSVAVKRNGENIKFLHKIVRGGVDESYGIEVAKLAGIPNKIINRARELLATLEVENERKSNAYHNAGQISFDAINDNIISDRLRKTNIDELSDDELRFFMKELLKYI